MVTVSRGDGRGHGNLCKRAGRGINRVDIQAIDGGKDSVVAVPGHSHASNEVLRSWRRFLQRAFVDRAGLGIAQKGLDGPERRDAAVAGTTLNHHGIGLGPVWSKYQRAAETGAAIETAGGTAKIDKRSTWDLGKLALRLDVKGVQVRFIISGKI